MLSNTSGEASIKERTYPYQFYKNGNFHMEDRTYCEREEVFEDAELEALPNDD